MNERNVNFSLRGAPAFLLGVFLSWPGPAAGKTLCPPAYADLAKIHFELPPGAKAAPVLMSIPAKKLSQEPGWAFTVPLLPEKEYRLITLKRGDSWLLDSDRAAPDGLEVRNLTAAESSPPADFSRVSVARENVLIDRRDFRDRFCEAHRKLREAPSYAELRKVYAGDSAANQAALREFHAKASACFKQNVAGFMTGGIAAFGMRLSTLDDPDYSWIYSHGSNFLYAVPMVFAANACVRQFLPAYPQMAALLAGSSFMAVNTYEELSIPGLEQTGHQRTKKFSLGGEQKVKTDWADFTSGAAGAAAAVGTLLFFSSELPGSIRLNLFCR